MKNKESTSSILDNIRKKMQKIDETNVIEHIELGDEFNYVDKASMQNDTKKIADNIINDTTKKTDSAIDEILSAKPKFDAAKPSDINNLVPERNIDAPIPPKLEPAPPKLEPTPAKVETKSVETKSEDIFPPQNNSANLDVTPKHDDLNLSDLGNLEEDHKDEHKDEHLDKKDDLDDLNLDDLDDLHDDHHEEKPSTEEHHDDFLDMEAATKEDDLNLNEISIDEKELNLLDDKKNLLDDKKIEDNTKTNLGTLPDNNKPTLDNNMISSKVAQEASNSIKQLLEQTSIKKPEIRIDSPSTFKTGETLESLVIAMLQPKLEMWLNENLTPIVEKIVANEIKKIVPKE